MTDALRAAKNHLAELEANGVAARDRPSALHYGLIKTLVEDLERAFAVDPAAATPHACEQCGSVNGHRGRFCSDKCKGRWHREHDPRGRVKTLRRLASGHTSVIVHFEDPDAERALRLMPGQEVVLGALP